MKKKHVGKGMWGIILMIMAIILLVGGTLAIYTSQVYQRAVVRNRYNGVIRFSSDKLYREKDENNLKKYYYPMSKNQLTMNFSVCNYDQTQNTLFNEKDIAYSIDIEVKNGTDDFDYVVSCGDTSKTLKTNGNTSMSGTLQSGKRSVDTYSVTINAKDYNKVEIYVTVTPTDPTTTQNNILNGILIPIEYATTQGISVRSEFIDSTRGTPDQFDAYNLLVSVSGGEGDVLITWDHTKLDIDPFFSTGKGITKNGNESTITVPMNSENETGTYLISFYNHNTAKPEWAEWKDLPISVTLKEPDTEPTTP